MAGLYVHIPFCLKKCGYCDFVSFDGQPELRDRYVDALDTNLEQFSGERFRTLYVGGGTPLALEVDQLVRLFHVIDARVGLSQCEELTVEANPETVTREKLSVLKSFGVGRLSIGFQSTHDTLLATLGRVHTAQTAFASFELARAAGFENINIDLMFGIPGQTATHWQESLGRVIACAPEHLSVYELTLSDSVPMEYLRSALNGDTNAQMYETAVSRLAAAGLARYEISNFSLPGRECMHNVGYWENEPYAGIGCGAWSYWNADRFRFCDDLNGYLKQATTDRFERYEVESLKADAARSERLVLGLRMARGISMTSEERSFCADRLASARSHGLVEWTDTHIALTEKGMLLANQVMRALL